MLRTNHDNFDALLICMVPPALECAVELETIIIELLLPVTIIHDTYDLTVQGSPGHQTWDPDTTPGPPPLLTSSGGHHWTADLFKLIHLKTSLKTSVGELSGAGH